MRFAAKIGMLECILCEKHFNTQDVTELKFFPSTGICFDCYKAGVDAPYQKWCFGKTNIYGPGGRILNHGYDPDVRECRKECPDRKLCPLFVTGQINDWKAGEMVRFRDVPVSEVERKKKQKQYTGPKLPFRQTGAMTTQAFLMCMKGVMVDDLVKWVKLQGGSSQRVLRIMRGGVFNGKRWKVNEANGYLKIFYEGQDA